MALKAIERSGDKTRTDTLSPPNDHPSSRLRVSIVVVAKKVERFAMTSQVGEYAEPPIVMSPLDYVVGDFLDDYLHCFVVHILIKIRSQSSD